MFMFYSLMLVDINGILMGYRLRCHQTWLAGKSPIHRCFPIKTEHVVRGFSIAMLISRGYPLVN